MNQAKADEQAILEQKTRELRGQLSKSLREPAIFYGKPTQRLAAQIAAQLIGQERQTPWHLCMTIDQIDLLRSRLVAAKV
ncbi:hypothetical protein [Ruegeria atlantica]|uniref:hypothetical protein n=1 Tax=Ruegeria atlantica TaxID=81569 RepID=UPI00147F4AF8|nr:hypothetical protein [Ruegeria atlantica]